MFLKILANTPSKMRKNVDDGYLFLLHYKIPYFAIQYSMYCYSS